MRPCHSFLRHEGLLGIGHLLVVTPKRSRDSAKRYTSVKQDDDWSPTNSVAQLSPYKPTHIHNSSIRSDEGLMFETSAFELITVANLHF